MQNFKDWSMKKKITVVSGIVVAFCVICGAVANVVSETNNNYLTTIEECQHVATYAKNYGFLQGIEKFGKKKLYFCWDISQNFNDCLHNNATTAFCGCYAYNNAYQDWYMRKGEIIYLAYLTDAGLISRQEALQKSLLKETDKKILENFRINSEKAQNKCSKYKNQ